MRKIIRGPNYSRPSIHDTMAETVIIWSERSTCQRYLVAAVIYTTTIKIPFGIGYNGAPIKHEHCIDIGCRNKNPGCGECLGAHAESNAFNNSWKKPWELDGQDVFVMSKIRPCSGCSKIIANNNQMGNIITVYYLHDYDRDPNSAIILRKAGIKLEKYESEYFSNWLVEHKFSL